MFVLLFLTAGISQVSADRFIVGACRQDVVDDSTDPLKFSVELKPSCQAGTIGWDYPQGELFITLLLPGQSFNLCLDGTRLTYLGGVQEVKGGVRADIPLPTEGKNTCTESVNGVAQLVATASKTQYYYTYIDYVVVKE